MDEVDGQVVIVPPPEMKQVVDKTAEYVAQVGSSFEAKVYAKEKNNPKFAFLLPQSHYHAYFRKMIESFKSGAPPVEVAPLAPAADEQQQALAAAEAAEAAAAAAAPQRVLERPAELRFLREVPESVTALALDVMQLLAQHVAVNGPAFQQTILNRERNNPLFAFLETTHVHHEFYLALVAQYAIVVEDHRDPNGTLRKALLAEDRAAALKRTLVRVEWEVSNFFFFFFLPRLTLVSSEMSGSSGHARLRWPREGSRGLTTICWRRKWTGTTLWWCK